MILTISQQAVARLSSYRTFISESRRLANTLGLSNADATHELMLEVFHRLKGWTSAQVLQAVTSDDPVFSWKITYARRELIRKHFKSVMKERYRVGQLKAGLEPSEPPADLCANTRTDDDIQEAISLLSYIFSNRHSQEWASYLLQFGEQETKAHFHQSTRQFKQKLNRTCKLAEQRQLTTVGLIASSSDKDLLNELNTLNSWHDLLARHSTTDADIAQWISQHEQYTNEMVDNPAIHKQGTLVHDFEQASKPDKYTLCNLMADRLSYIEHKLISR